MWCIIPASQFCIICELNKSVLCLTVQAINEDLEQDWIHY